MEYPEQKINDLLTDAKLIYERNQKLYQEKYERGEYYNVFTTLGLWSEEVRLHSAFIGNLLDANGSHGLGNKFILSFLKVLQKNHDVSFQDFSKASVKTSIEKSVGKVSYKDISGGRLDLELIFDDSYSLIIENKIYAGDQEVQLARYKDYAENKFKDNYTLLYLTLDGHDPSYESTNSKGDKDVYWTNISYKNDIIPWLNDCINISARHPLIRETLVQYLDLIKRLLHINTEIQMNEEFIDLLLKGNNLSIVEELANNIEEAKKKILTEKVMPLIVKEARSRQLQVRGEWYSSDKWAGVSFKREDWQFMIKFEFENRRCDNLYYGLTGKQNIKNTELNKKLASLYPYEKTSKSWFFYKYIENPAYRSWTAGTYQEFNSNPSLFVNYIFERVDDIIAKYDNSI